MKRISIAEQTLKKQIDHFYTRRAQVDHQIDLLAEQRAVYNQSILDLETEQSRLRTAREQSNKRPTHP